MALFSRHTGKPASNSKPQSHILADKLMHASFLEGAMCVGEQAQLRRFKHNDLAHLESLLQKRCNAEGNQDTLIVSEGVFSMDGDYAPSIEIAALAKQYNAWFMLDDAHGMGVLGENGFGSVEALGLTQEQVPIVMGTFGKAIGTAGAFIAGSQVLIDFLVNFAKHYVYSTAMPPAQAVATLYSLTHIASDRPRRDALTQNIMHFRDAFNAKFSGTTALTLAGSNSAIQPIIVGCPKRAVALSEGLKRRGIWVTAIRYPTVPKNEDRLRVTLSANHTHNHTQQDIDVLLDAIALAAEECSE
jgi:8-amino-7-oxononanoate synthase